MANKYWGLRAAGNNHVITRKRGDIPGISLPHDVFVQVDPVELHAAIDARNAEFCRITDEDRGTQINNHPFFRQQIVNPVTLRNPSSRVRNSWDWDFQG